MKRFAVAAALLAMTSVSAIGQSSGTPASSAMLAIGQNQAGELTTNDNQRRSGKYEDVYEFEGRRYDCGSKLGYLEATVDFGLQHREVGDGFRRFLDGRA